MRLPTTQPMGRPPRRRRRYQRHRNHPPFVCGLVLLLLTLLCAPAATAHKFHTSFAEADYVAAEQSLQVTLRTFPDDLETLLSRRAGRPVSLDDRQAAAAATFAYLQEVFQLQDAAGRLVPLTWVGMETSVDSVRLYFEAKLPAGPAGAQLRDQWLADLYEDQVNQVNFRLGAKHFALTFERGTGFQRIPAQ